MPVVGIPFLGNSLQSLECIFARFCLPDRSTFLNSTNTNEEDRFIDFTIAFLGHGSRKNVGFGNRGQFLAAAKSQQHWQEYLCD
jgi:hypothetical protein